MEITVDYLKNYPHFVPEISEYFYQEWSYLCPERDLQGFEDSIRSRLNVDRIPLALVAVGNSNFYGTVCLKQFDMDTRKELSPWLAGLYVKEGFRNRGLGRLLAESITGLAGRMGIGELFLYTPNAESFYLRLGWSTAFHEQYHGTDVCIMKKSIERNFFSLS